MICELASDAGFFSGTWDGLVAIFALVFDIFWEMDVYNHCQQSWWYDLGFLVGFSLVCYVSWEWSPWILVGIFIAWIIAVIFTTVIYGAVIAVIFLTVIIVWDWFKSKFNQIG